MTANHYTPTERRILRMLHSGQPVPVWQLRECLGDELAQPSALRMHISRLRKKLQHKGLAIDCVYRNRIMHYRINKHFSFPPSELP